MDVACTAVGVDAPTLKRWLALGEAAYRECEEEDPHCRFFEAFVKALDDADQAVEAKRRGPTQSEPGPPPRPRSEPSRTRRERSSEMPPLVWLVVEEAPIEIVIGSRPPWVYETAPTSPPVRSPDSTQLIQPDVAPSEQARSDPADAPGSDPRRDPTVGEVVEALGVLAIALVVLIAIVLLTLAVIPVALTGFALIGSIRLALGIADRWRAGLIALRGGSSVGLPIPAPVSRNARGHGLRPVEVVPLGRTSGSIALAGRSRPQRE